MLGEGASALLGYYDADFGKAAADELGESCHFVGLDLTEWSQRLKAID